MSELDRLQPRPLQSFAKLFRLQLVVFLAIGVIFAAAELIMRGGPTELRASDFWITVWYLGFLGLLALLRDGIVSHRFWFRPCVSLILIGTVIDTLIRFETDSSWAGNTLQLLPLLFPAAILGYLYFARDARTYFQAIRNAA